MSFLTEHLNSTHNKKEFYCGKSMLDDYLQRQAGQDIKRKLSACFVINDNETNLIKGYYTLSNSSISLELIPEAFAKNLPKSYKVIPTTLIGRLAVDNRYKGMNVGKFLLIDSLKRAFEISNIIGSFAVIVDPIDEEAKSFYYKYGFMELPDSGKMFLPMNIIKQLFE